MVRHKTSSSRKFPGVVDFEFGMTPPNKARTPGTKPSSSSTATHHRSVPAYSALRTTSDFNPEPIANFGISPEIIKNFLPPELFTTIQSTFVPNAGLVVDESIQESNATEKNTEPPQELHNSYGNILSATTSPTSSKPSNPCLKLSGSSQSPENVTPPSSTPTSKTEVSKGIRCAMSNIQLAPEEDSRRMAQEVSRRIRDAFAERDGFINATLSIPIPELDSSVGSTSSDQNALSERMSTPELKDNSMETVDSVENSKKIRKRKTKEVGAQPSRKSRRLREQEKEAENLELIVEELPRQGKLDLGVIPPLGPGRRPFHFSDFSFDEPVDRLMRQLEVTMNDNGKKSRVSITAPLEKNDKKDENAEYCETTSVEIGDEYQAELPALLEEMCQIEEEEERDECLWRNPNQKELEESLGRYRPPTFEEMENYFHVRVQKDYWIAIWRQFKGHIPFEMALQHLMKNNYSVLNALETIDQCLKILPQPFKDVCMEQAKRFLAFQKEHLRLAKKEKRLPYKGVSHAYESTNRREIQKKVLRNYHLGEIGQFVYQFHRFHLTSEEISGEVGCNCEDFITTERVFEPRFACKNCTKHTRDTSGYNESKICFICQKFKELAGIDRPVRNLVLNDDELRRVRAWNRYEECNGQKYCREEFENWEKQGKIARLSHWDLTEEEMDMLTINKNGRLIPPLSKSQFESLNQQAQKKKIEEIMAKLEPLVLPQFVSCNCKRFGRITRHSTNFEFQMKKLLMLKEQLKS